MAAKTKASDKQAVCKKVVTALKKQYTGKPPESKGAVLETILYAICVENSTDALAEKAFQKLHADFFDLNEIRVSSIREIEFAFTEIGDAEHRALRVRTVLHHVFESHYEFEFESIRKKTLDLASRQLARIKNLSPFIRLYTLQNTLGSHVVPVDDWMSDAAKWLGFAEIKDKQDVVADSLKSAVRKADAPLFCHLLRSLATDKKYRAIFETIHAESADPDDFSLDTGAKRLADLLAGKIKKPRKKAAAEPDPEPKKSVKKTAKKAPAKKVATKKAAPKKAAAKKKAKKK